jgi:hypothetical protein
VLAVWRGRAVLAVGLVEQVVELAAVGDAEFGVGAVQVGGGFGAGGCGKQAPGAGGELV